MKFHNPYIPPQNTTSGEKSGTATENRPDHDKNMTKPYIERKRASPTRRADVSGWAGGPTNDNLC